MQSQESVARPICFYGVREGGKIVNLGEYKKLCREIEEERF